MRNRPADLAAALARRRLLGVHRRAGFLATLALVVAGCGGGSTVTAGGGTPSTGGRPGPTATAIPPIPTVADPGPTAPATTTPDRSASIVPSVTMHDIGRGTTVDLASLIPAPRPVLLWFWAPH